MLRSKLSFFFRFRNQLIAVCIGAVLGYLYYYFVGCNSGSCAISSNPLNSILYGSFMGFLLTYETQNINKSK